MAWTKHGTAVDVSLTEDHIITGSLAIDNALKRTTQKLENALGDLDKSNEEAESLKEEIKALKGKSTKILT